MNHISQRLLNATLKSLSLLGVALVFVVVAAKPAAAYLGSFEPADGYTINQIPGSPPSDFIDVVYYNAGQWGANAGGGSATPIAYNSGLWKLNSEPGAYFTTSAVRSSYVGTAPPYPAVPTSVTVPIYVIGNHFGGRTGSALALRNDSVNTGPMDYNYSIDTYDFGGLTPASVTSGTVGTGFYFCPNPGDASNPGGGPAGEKFIMSFVDSAASIGLQIGYARDNEVYWRPGSSGAWNYTGVIADSSNYDGFQVDIDLTADTFGIDYFDYSASTWSTLVPSGTALGNPMQNLTQLGWWLDDSLSSGIGGKNFFDDFTFQVPEPASMTLLGMAVAGMLLSRRRRKS